MSSAKKIKSGDQTAELLRQKLKLKKLTVRKDLESKHPHAVSFFERKGLDIDQIRQHSAKLLAAGTLAGNLFLGPSAQLPPLPPPLIEAFFPVSVPTLQNPQDLFVSKLKNLLPEKPRPLQNDLEKLIGKIFESLTGIKARATLEGEHLNTSYGYIGAEQHLLRFPGDNIYLHDEFRNVGMAPHHGGWGYFASSRSDLTEQAVMREKYYVAIQIMYFPDWPKRWRYLVDWYKWRKVVVMNTENGNAVVAVVGDAGPAAWTGKQFGGSPEVMNALGGKKFKKGKVLIFFVDDPENKIPLGPVKYLENIPLSKLE